jgi:hypothetical protein
MKILHFIVNFSACLWLLSHLFWNTIWSRTSSWVPLQKNGCLGFVSLNYPIILHSFSNLILNPDPLVHFIPSTSKLCLPLVIRMFHDIFASRFFFRKHFCFWESFRENTKTKIFASTLVESQFYIHFIQVLTKNGTKNKNEIRRRPLNRSRYIVWFTGTTLTYWSAEKQRRHF